MGIISKFFAKKESTHDEERGSTQVIMPDKVDRLVCVVRSGDKGPSSSKDKNAYIWKIFKEINPLLYEIMPHRSKVTSMYLNTTCMDEKGYIDSDDIFDILDELKVPNTYSSYLQTMTFHKEKAVIKLREENEPDQEHEVKLPTPYDTQRLPTDVMLMIIYKSNEGATTSSLYPAEPRVRYLPKKYLKDFELEMLKKTEVFLTEKMEKEKLISKDDLKRGQDDVQNLTGKEIAKVDEILVAKEKEVMEI